MSKKVVRIGPYVFGKTLGTGVTSRVKLAQNVETGETVAIKIVRKDLLERKPQFKVTLRKEISVLSLLSHPNIMSLIDVFEINTHLFLVMEYVDGLELFEYLVRCNGPLSEAEALNFFQQVICGLEYCHRRLICHRDLKPENILLDKRLNVKIADFGMTSLSPPGEHLETQCGSPHYADPMILAGAGYDGCKADIWSCGVTLYAMVTGRLPFDDDNVHRLLAKVKGGKFVVPEGISNQLRDLILRMLTVDPEMRITLDGIKAHPWFKSIPPNFNYVDDFVVPTGIVPDPDPVLVKSLVDLGWGDDEIIRKELSVHGGNVLKVFYVQLQKHPMSRRHRRIIHPPAASASDSASASTAAAAAEVPRASTPRYKNYADEIQPNHRQRGEMQMQQPTQCGVAPVEHISAAVTAGIPPLYPAPVQAQPKGRKHTDQADMSRSHSAMKRLVRQSSYARLPSSPVARKVDPEEGIQQQLAELGPQSPSWFDSVRSYFANPDDSSQANSETLTSSGVPRVAPDKKTSTGGAASTKEGTE